MWSGDHPGLQNRRAAGYPVTGGFDSHSLPPFIAGRKAAMTRRRWACIGMVTNSYRLLLCGADCGQI